MSCVMKDDSGTVVMTSVLLQVLMLELVSAAILPRTAPQPEFVTRPGAFKVREGDSVILPCSVKNLDNNALVWRQGKRVLTARDMVVESDSRISLVGDHSLKIDRIKREDATNFTCTVSSKPILELTHRVEVLYGPVVTTVPHSGLVIANQMDNITLGCEADGNPAPDLHWRKQHGSLPAGMTQSSGQQLKIYKITRQMAGVYECVAENGLGAPNVATVSVQVQYPPEVEVEKATVYTGENMDVQIVCFVFADPPAAVSWEREGSVYFDPDRHFTSHNEVGGTRHILTIQNVRAEDFGTYTCTGKNALGSATAKMALTGVPDRPVVTSGQMSAAPDAYDLSWGVQSFSPILEYRVAYRTSKPNWTQSMSDSWKEVKVPSTGSETSNSVQYQQKIPLSRLQPATSYDLHVQAKNKHGWSAISDILHFSTIAKGEAALESRSVSSSGSSTAASRNAFTSFLIITAFFLIPAVFSTMTSS